MIILLLFLMADTPSTTAKLNIPSHLKSPVVNWSDLNGDGITDIWAYESSKKAPDQADTIWVYDGTWQDGTFKAIRYQPMLGKKAPVGDGKEFWARTYHQGVVLDYHEANGWELRTDFNKNGNVRPGMSPIELGGGLLVPTYSGYQLLEGDCLQASFNAHPAIEVVSKKMTLTWPMPQLRDLDGDGQMDLVAPPVRSPQHGDARIWYALRRGNQWQEGSCRVEFPNTEAVAGYNFGDLDGDGISELLIITRPAKDLSIFEEMNFRIYSGTTTGQWEPIPTQVLKTNQNLWQNGPVEMDKNGITFYYFKGLIRDKFRIDRFHWDKAGYLNPKPSKAKWKLDDADRGLILLDYDLNSDGMKDLVLSDEEGMKLYYRREGKLPFPEKPNRVLKSGRNNMGRSFSVNLGGDSSYANGQQGLRGKLTGKGSALVKGHANGGPSLWSMWQEDDGFWSLSQESITEAFTR